MQKIYDILGDRLSLPLTVKETLTVQEVLQTPPGETVLDFGPKSCGAPSASTTRHQKGTKIYLQVGEILPREFLP